MTDLVRLGKAISERRKQLGLTQKDLGGRIGIELNSVSRIETGKADVSQTRLGEIAAALDTTVADLMTLANMEAAEDRHRRGLMVREATRLYSPDAAVTLPSKVYAHAHRIIADLADEGADEHGLDLARRTLLAPQHYTFSAHGRVVMMDEADIVSDMDAIAAYLRKALRDRRRLAEGVERERDE